MNSLVRGRAMVLGAAILAVIGGEPVSYGVGPSKYVLHSTRFEGTNLPAGWIEQGGWKVNNGLLTPTNGAFDCFAVWNIETGLDFSQLDGTIRFNRTNTQIGLVRRDISRGGTEALVAGTLGLVDGAAGKLCIYRAWNGTNQPLVQASVDIPFALREDREYVVSLWRTDAGHHSLALRDTVSGESAQVAAIRSPTSDPGKQMDAPGFLFLSGSATFTAMEFWTPCPQAPRLMVVGDSLSEGEALKPDHDKRYCQLLADALGGNCVTTVRGRESSITVFERLDFELDLFSPQYVFLLLGINDVSLPTWWTNINSLAALVAKHGAIPILGTVPPNQRRPNFFAISNPWIRASGHRYVDLARAVTLNQDGMSCDVTLQTADKIHPNAAGNRAMFERFLADAPYLFDTAPSFHRVLRACDGSPGAGTSLRLPIELTSSGAETSLAFSLLFDPAVLKYTTAFTGDGLPGGTQFSLATNQAQVGRLGVRMQLAPGQALSRGTQTILHVCFDTASSVPFPSTTVAFCDEPVIRQVCPLSIETWRSGTVTVFDWTEPTPWRQPPGTDIVWIEDSLPVGARIEPSSSNVWTWAEDSPMPVSGSRACRAGPAAGLHALTFHVPSGRFSVDRGDRLLAYAHLPETGKPRMVMLQWKDDGGSWEHRAYWGDNLWPHSEDSPVRRRFMGRLPDAPGWTRLETPALWVGLEGRGVHGMSFVLYDGTAAFDHVGKVVPAVDTVWLSGKLPPGAQTEPGGGESWQWITNGLPPFAGRLAHFSPPAAGYRQHQFTGGTQGWKVGPDESLFCWVHMDPGNPPSMVALLWQDNGGSWEHRAFWGADNLPAGTRGTAGRRHAGPLPPGDEWIRLSVPATLVGLENKVVTGLGFGLHDGTALWLDAGKASPDSAFPPGGLLNARLLPEGYFRIILFGRPQERYALMSSSNMVDWRQSKTVTILESGQAAAYFPSDQPQRFFRALLQQ